MNQHITIPRPAGLTETDLCAWIGQAQPGDILEYYRGFLAVDIADGRLARAEQKMLRRLARRAAWAWDAGLVHLVQRRNGPGDFSYLAIVRPRCRRATPVAPSAEDVA